MEGKTQIADMLLATLKNVKPSDWKLAEEATSDEAMSEAWITFETSVARGRGHLRLKNGKCWTLLTTMVELKGHEEKKGEARSKGIVHGALKNRENWAEMREREVKELGYKKQPYCVIIGGGQGGIGLGSRMRRLAVPTIIIEKNKRPSDSWRNRYKSLCLSEHERYKVIRYMAYMHTLANSDVQ